VKIKKYVKVAFLLIILVIIIILNIKVILFMDKIADEEVDKRDNYEKTVNIKGISGQNIDNYTGHREYYSPILLESSSEIKGYGDNNYSADNLLDGNRSSAWIAGRKKDNEEDYIYVEFEEKVSLSGVEFLNGYCKSPEIYKKNSRVGRIEIELDEKYRIAAELKDEYRKYQSISFGKDIEVKCVKIIIKDIVKGAQQDKPALSELHFYKLEE
jgi:hypothetical protein